MRRISVFVCIAVLGFGGVLMRRRVQGPALPRAEAAIDTRQPTAGSDEKAQNREQLAQVTEVKAIPLNDTLLGNVADVKLDDRGWFYFNAQYPSASPGKGRIIRLNPTSQQYDEINPGLPGGKQVPESSVLQSYDVDRSGNIYLAMAKPEAVLIQDARGVAHSEIDLGDFLPGLISADADGNVWVGGRVLLSRNPITVGGTEIRVYNRLGKLLNVPAISLDKDDLRMARFAHSRGRSSLIAGARIYDFRRHDLAAAREYPFKISQISPLSLTGRRPLSQNHRLILGLSYMGKDLISYGVLPDEKGKLGGEGFVTLISPSGEALTSELLIPKEYGSPVAAERDGSLYCLGKRAGQMVLTKIKVRDLDR